MLFCVLLVGMARSAYAARTVTIVAEKQRGDVAAKLTRSFTIGTEIVRVSGTGRTVIITGPGGKENIDISDKLLRKLQNYLKNPQSGLTLLDVCPTQGSQFKRVWGEALQPLVTTTVSVAPPPTPAVKHPASAAIVATCDEGEFSGRVPDAIMALQPNGADAIEVQYRPTKSKGIQYKAKRGRVSGGVFYPRAWPDGSCMHNYGNETTILAKLPELTYPGESYKQVFEPGTQEPFTDHRGSYDTISLFIISGSPTSTVPVSTVPKSSESLVFKKSLPRAP
jgi:hypothetical protein